ncbi:hypothetical protein JTB14_003482 [Gonioctena quinquepunctata]|nr:hypothetical protein JTB14_003482 [Gonioctena quinquepunctata]
MHHLFQKYYLGDIPKENRCLKTFYVYFKTHEGVYQEVDKLVKYSFKTKHFGMKFSEENGRSKEDNEAMNLMENTINALKIILKYDFCGKKLDITDNGV